MKKENGNEMPKLKQKEYESELRRLQGELCHLQEWVKAKGLRMVIVFEGRDGAGKGIPHTAVCGWFKSFLHALPENNSAPHHYAT